MSRDDLNTTRLHRLVHGLREGDRKAADELVRAVLGRMELLARLGLRRSPVVRRWVDAEDILQNAVLRLRHALLEFRPESTRIFFRIAAEMVRRELIDMARQLRGRCGLAANHESNPGPTGSDQQPVAPPEPPDELLQWETFHQMVQGLGDEAGEVFRLRYYHDLSNDQIAELLGINEKTVRRYYRHAREALAPALEQWLRASG